MPRTRLVIYLIATYLVFAVAGYGCAVKKPALKCGALYASMAGPNGWLGCPSWPFEGTTPAGR